MKTLSRSLALAATAAFLLAGTVQAQVLRDLQNYRTPGQYGLNVFEPTMEDAVEFDGLFLRPGGDFAIQFQPYPPERLLPPHSGTLLVPKQVTAGRVGPRKDGLDVDSSTTTRNGDRVTVESSVASNAAELVSSAPV